VRQRRAALSGLKSIGGEEAVPDFIRCLADESPALVRDAARTTQPWLHRVPARELFDLATGTKPWHVQKNACLLIFEMGRWVSLPWLFRLIAGKDQRVAVLAEHLAQRWFSPPRSTRVFTTLEDSNRQAVEDAISKNEPRLPVEFVAQVRDWLTRS
jgi:hypothetical protein